MRMRRPRRSMRRAESGFAMIVTIGVMFVTGLLLVAAFTIARGEVGTTQRDTQEKLAYYAALAGVQEYQYELQSNPNYWETCEGPKGSVPEEGRESYEITVLPASTAPTGTTSCETASPFASVIQSSGELANTFRIKSKGKSGPATRTLIATFKVSGFLDFIYFTNFETEDPSLYNAPSGCIEKYYSEWNGKYSCNTITFTSGDSVEGPMHTNDAAKVEGTATFGREGESPPDVVEIYGGTYPDDTGENCSGGQPTFFTTSKCYVKGEKILMPEGDTSLEAYVESEDEFTNETRLELNGTANTIHVVNFNEKGEQSTKTMNWPKNGLIFVKPSSCGWPVSGVSEPSYNADGTTEAEDEKGCGTVYVKGTYSKSLTIAAVDDVVINGDVYPTTVAGKLGSAPTGTATLGLIAGNYVRVYHPVSSSGTDSESSCTDSNLSESEDPNHWGSLSNPWIYAAILSTDHSFLVDNPHCGATLGELNVYGAIAQDYRGIVGQVGSHGYLKEYKYDSRLAVDEPPYFLAPLKAGWKVIRETAPGPG